MARHGWLVVAALASGLAGCVPEAVLPKLPSQGGPAWVEITSPHFVMWTDATEARGKELIVRMEHHRLVVLHALDNKTAAGKIFVIALRDAAEVRAFVPKEFAAYAMPPSNPSRQPTIVIAADTSDEPDQRSIITHELTHVVTYTFLPVQPKWFAEGIAGFFATATFYGDSTVVLGRPLGYVARELRQHQPTPIAQLFACESVACSDQMFYASTWALFSFLVNNKLADLNKYVSRLAVQPRGDRNPPSWAEVVGTQDLGALDHELSMWLHHGEVAVLKFDLAPVPVTPTVRPLAEGDVLASRALLRLAFQRKTPEAPASLAAALAADPTNVLARLVESASGHELSIADARAITAAHPDDWRAWWLAARVIHTGAEGHDIHDKLCGFVLAGDAADAPPGYCGH